MDDQLPLPFDEARDLQPGPVPHLREEIARVWGLPLGEWVEVSLRRGPCDSLRGRLQLAVAPDEPWNSHAPLGLSIADVPFSSHDIARWVLVERF